jgi:hypothetical protein
MIKIKASKFFMGILLWMHTWLKNRPVLRELLHFFCFDIRPPSGQTENRTGSIFYRELLHHTTNPHIKNQKSTSNIF